MKIYKIDQVLENKALGATPVFVIQNLPNRFCAANSSPEISCEDETCAKGLDIYKTEFINEIAGRFAYYHDV